MDAAGVDRGKREGTFGERVDDKAAISPPPPHLLLHYTVPSILAEACDSFERTAFRVTARVTTAKSRYNANSPSNLEIKFVIPDFRYIEFLLYIVIDGDRGNSIESHSKENSIFFWCVSSFRYDCVRDTRCSIGWLSWRGKTVVSLGEGFVRSFSIPSLHE